MNEKEFEKINNARKLLGIPEAATLPEIKKAFNKMAKKYHPDVKQNEPEAQGKMVEVLKAYETIVNYCGNYTFSFKQDDVLAAKYVEENDPEALWRKHYGDDPLWGSGKDWFK